MNRKVVVLLVLLAVLAFALGYAFFASPGRESSALVASKPRTGAPQKTAPQDKMVVNLELLEGNVESFRDVKRDLFGPLFPPPKVEKRPVAPPPVALPPPPPPVIKPPTPVEIVRRELAKFTFMGYLRKQDKWTIFLSDNNEIFLVQEGDRFGKSNQFHAVQITPQELVIMQASQGRIVIPLVEQQPLVPSIIPSAPRGTTNSADTSSLFDSPDEDGVPVPAPGGGARSLRSNPFRPNAGSLPPTTPPSPEQADGEATTDEVTQ